VDIAVLHRSTLAQVGLALPLAAGSLPGQGEPPWLGASVGIGTAYIGGISAGGLSTDLSGGLTATRHIRIGARLLGFTEVDIAGDQPGWSAHTVLGIASYTIDSSLTLSSGFGTMTTHQTDSSISGTGAVCETGIELTLPRRTGPAVRMFALRTWPLARTKWRGTTYPYGNAAQLHVGLGVLFR
jgi:hypothetical protein